jgi:hypothetical protein
MQMRMRLYPRCLSYPFTPQRTSCVFMTQASMGLFYAKTADGKLSAVFVLYVYGSRLLLTCSFHPPH